jgi:hypothetical protein
MLEDIVLPAEIVGKRVRYRIDGSKIMKVTPLHITRKLLLSVCVSCGNCLKKFATGDNMNMRLKYDLDYTFASLGFQ